MFTTIQAKQDPNPLFLTKTFSRNGDYGCLVGAEQLSSTLIKIDATKTISFLFCTKLKCKLGERE